jgi:hypothetical protein
MEEIWKETEYQGYWVSNMGRVQNRNKTPFYTMAPNLKPSGYVNTLIKKKTLKVARLVAKAFVPNPHNKNVVNHKNGIRSDDRAENLEWVTQKENIHHARDVLGAYIGENNSRGKFKKADVADIFKLYRQGVPKREIARRKGVSDTAIRLIITKQNWSSFNENHNE